MAKILIYSDLHWCEKSSIVTQLGKKYSLRLEHCIDSLNWLHKLAEEKHVDLIVNCGDVADRNNLSSMEITALQDIKWPENIPTYIVCGNHEGSVDDLRYNSAYAFTGKNRILITKPETIKFNNVELCMLPYITEASRKPIKEYFGNGNISKRIIFSHNDIRGEMLNGIESKAGFTVAEFESIAALTLNGHWHNMRWVDKDKVLLVGNFVGKDFGEDADKHPHGAWLLDTDTMKLEFFENPYSFNFYKISINNKKDFKKCLHLKNNAIIYISVRDNLVNDLKELLEKQTNIIAYRLVLTHELSNEATAQENVADLRMDYLKRFIDCCKDKLEHTKLLDEELSKICGSTE